ncbi:2OG-Fe(II) oxygenase [Leptothoe sp. EHU-05/26/07-4]
MKQISMKPIIDGVWEIPHFLSPEECMVIILKAEMLGFKPAQERSSGRYNQEVRLEETTILGTLAMRLINYLSDDGACQLQLADLGDLLECYRYDEGEYIAPHSDAHKKLKSGFLSNLTLIAYLNDDIQGGETYFSESKLPIAPKLGKAVIFKQALRHEGAKVLRGTKYIIRTDLACAGL